MGETSKEDWEIYESIMKEQGYTKKKIAMLYAKIHTPSKESRSKWVCKRDHVNMFRDTRDA